jgi:hypothetical protein
MIFTTTQFEQFNPQPHAALAHTEQTRRQGTKLRKNA